MNSRSPALIVCQAGEGIGLGHLSRSLVLANALRNELNAEVQMLIHGTPVEREDLSQFKHQFIPPTDDLGTAIVQTATSLQPWLLTLDLQPQRAPRNMQQILEFVHKGGCHVVAIDGLLQHRNQVDLVFLPSLRNDDPLGQGPGTPVAYGLDCFLLPPWRRTREWSPGFEVLILTGGADATELGKQWPQLLDKKLPTLTRPHWIQGPYASTPSFPIAPRLQWSVHHAPTSLRERMNSASYALTIFGVSYFELLKMGVPTVVYSPYGDKDLPDLHRIHSDGLGVVATDAADAIDRLVQLMQDGAHAKSIAMRGAIAMSKSNGQRLCQLVAGWQG